MKNELSMKDVICELDRNNSGFYGVRVDSIGNLNIVLYKDRFNVLGFDVKTCSKVFGFIHRQTAITAEISCQTLKVTFFTKAKLCGEEIAVLLDLTDYQTAAMSTSDALIMIKRELISNGMEKILNLPCRRRKALCAMLSLVNDDHVTKYKIGKRYNLVKHRGRLRLLFGDKIASDVNMIEELTKDMFRNEYPVAL